MCVFVQGASCPEPSTVYVDMQALRNDRVTLVEKGSPNSLCLMESGKVRTQVMLYTPAANTFYSTFPLVPLVTVVFQNDFSSRTFSSLENIFPFPRSWFSMCTFAVEEFCD